jgi:hypothetical protein
MFAGVVPATKVDAWQGSLMIIVNDTGVVCASTTAVSVRAYVPRLDKVAPFVRMKPDSPSALIVLVNQV